VQAVLGGIASGPAAARGRRGPHQGPLVESGGVSVKLSLTAADAEVPRVPPLGGPPRGAGSERPRPDPGGRTQADRHEALAGAAAERGFLTSSTKSGVPPR